MNEVLSSYYAREFNIPQELSAIISQRFPSYEEAKKFLFPSIDDLFEPDNLPDIENACAEIINSLNKGEDILIYAHDDPDGYTSTVILYQTLLDLSRKKDCGIFLYPIKREQDGYVLNPVVLDEYKKKGVKLIITVDFGISNTENFKIAKELEMNLVVCDHHETKLTNFSFPAVDPKRADSKYPFRELAGVGVVMKLCQYLYKKYLKLNINEFYQLKKEFFSIAMIGTIADRVMPLNENRVLCYEGLRAFNNIERPWAKYFLDSGDMDIPRIFNEIVPILQGASLDNPAFGIQFFLTNSNDEFANIITKLKAVEKTREKNIDELFQFALDAARVYQDIVISIVHDNPKESITHPKMNILGAVTSRLSDYFHKTTVCIMVCKNKCFGELRSRDVDLFELLNNFKDLFIDFGGHKRAAGFSMVENNLDKFTEALSLYKSISIREKTSLQNPEAVLDKSKIKMLKILLPFGEGNPAPLLTDGRDLYTINNKMNIIELGLWQT